MDHQAHPRPAVDGWLPHKIGYIHPSSRPRHYPGGLLHRGPHSHPDRPADQRDRRHRVVSQQRLLPSSAGTVFIPAHAGAVGSPPSAAKASSTEVHSGRRILRGRWCWCFFQIGMPQAVILVIITIVGFSCSSLRSGAVSPSRAMKAVMQDRLFYSEGVLIVWTEHISTYLPSDHRGIT